MDLAISKKRPIPVYQRPGTAPGHYQRAKRRSTAAPTIRVCDYDSSTLRDSAGLPALQSQLDDGLHRWVHSEGELPLDVLDTLHEVLLVSHQRQDQLLVSDYP